MVALFEKSFSHGFGQIKYAVVAIVARITFGLHYAVRFRRRRALLRRLRRRRDSGGIENPEVDRAARRRNLPWIESRYVLTGPTGGSIGTIPVKAGNCPIDA